MLKRVSAQNLSHISFSDEILISLGILIFKVAQDIFKIEKK